MRMTPQLFYNKTVRHLAKQGRPAMSPVTQTCMYRCLDDDGYGEVVLSCAIGCHITDELYKPEMEGTRIYGLLNSFPQLNPLIPNVTLAMDLQMVHDNVVNWQDPEKMVERLKVVARNHNLSTKTLDRIDFSKIKAQ